MPGFSATETLKPGSQVRAIKKIIRRPIQARAVQVHVWKNATGFAGIPDAHHPGHAAMQVYENGEVVRFVSWWPEGAVGKEDKTKVVRGKKGWRLSLDAISELGDHARGILERAEMKGNLSETARRGQYLHGEDDGLSDYNRLLRQQKERWMQLPEVSVSLPGMGAQGVRWGLHLPSIAEWWDEFADDAWYVMQSTTQNCSGAVASGLREGGAECYVPAPISWLYLSPNYIADWAKQLDCKLRTLELNTMRLKRKVTTAGPELARYPLPGPLPSKEAWLKASHLDRKPRSPQLHAIDSALNAYNQALSVGDFSVDKHKRLVQLTEAIYVHVMSRPASERRNWVLSLADKVLRLIDDINGHVGDVIPD